MRKVCFGIHKYKHLNQFYHVTYREAGTNIKWYGTEVQVICTQCGKHKSKKIAKTWISDHEAEIAANIRWGKYSHIR